jgi:hypothetical protein
MDPDLAEGVGLGLQELGDQLGQADSGFGGEGAAFFQGEFRQIERGFTGA